MVFFLTKLFIYGFFGPHQHPFLWVRQYRAGSQLKNVWTSDKSWEPDLSHTLSFSHSLTLSLSHSLTLSLFHSLTLSLSHSLTLNMLNNFCFHVYAQKSLSHFHTLTLSHSLILTLSQSHSHTLALSHSHALTLSHSHTLALSHSLILSFNHSRHAEQVLFSCLCSKVAVYSRKLQWFFGTLASPYRVTLEFIELVPS